MNVRAHGARVGLAIGVITMDKTVVKKRTSKQQIKANRKNAGKSTGPRTAEGKARSRLNALKHGLRAEHVVVLKGPDPENPEEFDALREGLFADRQPCGVLEQMLVERLAVGFWRLRRAYRFEAESIAQANKPSPVLQMLAEHVPLPVGERGTQVLPTKANMDKLVRYESMIDRELLRTLAQLRRLQQERKLDEEPSDSQIERPTRPLHAARPPDGPPQDAPKPQWPNEAIPQPSASRRTSSQVNRAGGGAQRAQWGHGTPAFRAGDYRCSGCAAPEYRILAAAPLSAQQD